jgi:hypothetical protein
VVYAREIGGRKLTFIVSGRLWRNSLIMQDRETGTYWSHVTGEALEGPLKGKKLSMLPAVHTTWKSWRDRHPATTVLEKGREILSSTYTQYFEDPQRTGIFRARYAMKRMPGKALVHGLRLGVHSLAVRDETLAVGAFVLANVGDEPVVVARGRDGGVRAFKARAEGKVLKFEWDEKTGAAVDTRTGSAWDLERGVAVEGELAGQRLEEIPVTLAFWFAWSNFNPDSDVL